MIRKRKSRRQLSRRTLSPRLPIRRLFNHPEPLVSIIIPVMNEKTTLPAVLYQASRVHPNSEVIVVANGSTDGTAEIAAKWGARLIRFDEPLGHDVGRRVGAEVAKGEVLLFIDGDMVIPAKELRPFVKATLAGVDVALNGYSGPVEKQEAHPVVLAKYVLNAILSRSDLKGASMTAVPHALSRRCLQTVGSAALEVPPLAYAMAVSRGLNVQAVHTVPVGKLNPVRVRQQASKRKGDPLTTLVAGDHLEALHWLVMEHGARGGFSDLGRQRGRVRG
ncbi:glycosyltransferase family 2 protein [Paenibacillus segetis]|uniref:Glycosyltransferase 2-like domain-containing protein n=1 Tax=Paenibacillus segetis TaxID=1325360 RepID=A0ABQ1YPS8_9BACL|nr:glycosyltransferase [Paenibacillus segetis]GGH34129.1 hypothetical protein GCM10008013_39660 [Paenibacillus segetis]